ncbi:hypothetical protein MLD38_008616 [Melastoma candidum]|uniref:Uncharacterized protein n=1 Tax=Melastoma candidum TaxID=119954 RepID=A0ACB9RUB5_9MYRT|nr:hypothetical protein MLD38_008616 [Melastoma candidum]
MDEYSSFICENKDSKNKPSCPDTKLFTAPVAFVIIGRVKDFLGVMSEANRRLEVDAKWSQENSDNYDIEVLSRDEPQIIEMPISTLPRQFRPLTNLRIPHRLAPAELTQKTPPATRTTAIKMR